MTVGKWYIWYHCVGEFPRTKSFMLVKNYHWNWPIVPFAVLQIVLMLFHKQHINCGTGEENHIWSELFWLNGQCIGLLVSGPGFKTLWNKKRFPFIVTVFIISFSNQLHLSFSVSLSVYCHCLVGFWTQNLVRLRKRRLGFHRCKHKFERITTAMCVALIMTIQ